MRSSDLVSGFLATFIDVVLARLHMRQKGFLGKCVRRCFADFASAIKVSRLDGFSDFGSTKSIRGLSSSRSTAALGSGFLGARALVAAPSSKSSENVGEGGSTAADSRAPEGALPSALDLKSCTPTLEAKSSASSRYPASSSSSLVATSVGAYPGRSPMPPPMSSSTTDTASDSTALGEAAASTGLSCSTVWWTKGDNRSSNCGTYSTTLEAFSLAPLGTLSLQRWTSEAGTK